MALLFCDSFDYYSTAQTSRKWSSTSFIGAAIGAVGRNGTNGIQLNGQGGDTNSMTWNFPATKATIIAGMAIKFTTTSPQTLFGFYDAGTLQVYLKFNTDGSLSVINGAGTTLGTTSPGVVASPTVQHNYIEFKSTISDAAGTAVVRVNGTTVLNLSSVDTKNSANAYATQLIVFTSLITNHLQIDDLYVCDTAGSVNNDFLGDVRIECIRPSGAGTTTNFTPSAGSNYQCVDENPANDDTDYVSSTTVGHKDLYAFGDLSSSVGSVLAVVVNTVDRKDDAGSRTQSHLLLCSGTEAESAAFSPTTSYANHQSVFETRPGGGSWTIADVNSTEGGHKVVS